MARAITTWSSTIRIEAATRSSPPGSAEIGHLAEAPHPRQASTGHVSRPVVLVVASPYAGATALSRLLSQQDRYDVVVPDIGAGEEVPSIHFDAVLATLRVPAYTAPVVIELPWSWDAPVQLTVNGVKQDVQVSGDDAMTEVLALLDRLVVANTHLRTG